MQVIHAFGHLVGGTLLVAGTSIGVGMLALPVQTASGGFFPSIILYFFCWLFMLMTGLLILEACVWMPKNANLITLSERLLGKWGKRSCWILYLFLFSCLMIAHVAGAGQITSDLFPGAFSEAGSMILYVLLFSPIIYFGTLWVDRINLFLMFALGIAYCILVASSIHYVTPSFLTRVHWNSAFSSLPIIFTAFGYQSLIPTLFNYMNRNIARVRLAIILGTSIPLVIYVLWQLLILGIVPLYGPSGLQSALENAQNAVIPLSAYLRNSAVLTTGRIFAFLALTTSYLGISIAFLDFLLDGFKIGSSHKGRIITCCFIFLIPLIICLINPHLFLIVLRWAGGIGVSLLLGMMPILMVWAGRYYRGHSLMHEQVRGGKFTLTLLFAFVLLEIGITLLS